MALCLAESLTEKRGFDPVDQLTRYTRWFREGYLSSTGRCFDIGRTVRTALETFDESHKPYCGPTDTFSAGNGSIMRLAPVPLFFASAPRKAIELAGESSKTTHGAPEAVDACRYLAALIIGAINGVDKETLLSDHFDPAGSSSKWRTALSLGRVAGVWSKAPLAPSIDAIASGSYKQRNPPEIRGLGYVVASLEAALWAFYHSNSFREGALLAVNLGDDADTTGAVYGQLAGAYYGDDGIPSEWRSVLSHHEYICSVAKRLYVLSADYKSTEGK
jgi:ADP-ribosylglycohydrolase